MGRKPREVRVITVEVTPEEAEKLALAAHEGKVTMALRNYTNTQPILTSGATVSTLLNSYQFTQRQRQSAGQNSPSSARRATSAGRNHQGWEGRDADI